MIIKKKPQDAQSFLTGRQKANEGCDKCPFCETPTEHFALRLITKGIFKIRYYNQDVYRCSNCRAEWDSELYEQVKEIK